MTEFNLLSFLIGAGAGLVVGVLLTLLTHKLRSGSASPVAVKKEMDEYQQKVEAHFDQTSEKFRAMAEQYKDLYQHLSVGATSLCRPEHVVSGLSDDSNPLQSLPQKQTDSKSEKSATAKSQQEVKPQTEDKQKMGKESIDEASAAEQKSAAGKRASESKQKTGSGAADAKKADDKLGKSSKPKNS